jgi:hypothetical protein
MYFRTPDKSEGNTYKYQSNNQTALTNPNNTGYLQRGQNTTNRLAMNQHGHSHSHHHGHGNSGEGRECKCMRRL